MTLLELESKLLELNKELKDILRNKQYYVLTYDTKISLSVDMENTARLLHRVLDKFYEEFKI